MKTTYRIRDELFVIDLHGEDVSSWLQGQLTQDLRGMKSGEARYGLFVSKKGKIEADAWILFRTDEHSTIVTQRAARGVLEERIEKYIIMEDVEVTFSHDVVISVQGPHVQTVLAECASDSLAWPCGWLDVTGRDIVAPATSIDAIGKSLATCESVDGMDESQWEQLRIKNAVPRFGVDFDAAYVPQEAGLSRCVSFEKGCYLGQEVVCMLESRGRLTRKLVSLESKSVPQVVPGDELRSEDEQSVGKVTSIAEFDGGSVALGYLKTRCAVRGQLVFSQGQTFTVAAVVGETAD